MLWLSWLVLVLVGCEGEGEAFDSWRDLLEEEESGETSIPTSGSETDPEDGSIVECDVIEHRGEILQCDATSLWCDASEQGLERQLACCDCDDGDGICRPTPDPEICAAL